MSGDLYIWITRWEDFQHYAPERDRAPAWLKTYTKQLDDDRYTDLSPRRRALLHDLRTAFARTSGNLSIGVRQRSDSTPTTLGQLPDRAWTDTSTLSRRILCQVRHDDLLALNRAGLIEFISRPTLEQRLEAFYASRAPARSKEKEVEREEELEEEIEPRAVSEPSNGTDSETDSPRFPIEEITPQLRSIA